MDGIPFKDDLIEPFPISTKILRIFCSEWSLFQNRWTLKLPSDTEGETDLWNAHYFNVVPEAKL